MGYDYARAHPKWLHMGFKCFNDALAHDYYWFLLFFVLYPPLWQLETEEHKVDVLGVEVFRHAVNDDVLVGNYCSFTNKGGLVRTRILMPVSHMIKGNLAAISTLINLQGSS
ncbi:Eukaryotic translation initiation factor 6 [Platanthera guangdongensis]|uniref:Eukaryotic translation initiation factor 6 n=1 Tax=Platanthera guangdongensis TaxID=2320717 RepID=A0ABR2LU67_9ASPA